jgi:hypothetical protein
LVNVETGTFDPQPPPPQPHPCAMVHRIGA